MFANTGAVTELCDDANQINGDGCSASCVLETPVCGDYNISWSPTAGAAALTVTGTFTPVTGFTISSWTRASGVVVTNPTSPVVHTYGANGTYTGVVRIENALSGSYAVTCEQVITVSNAPIAGVCGAASGATYYGQGMLTGGNTDLCGG